MRYTIDMTVSTPSEVDQSDKDLVDPLKELSDLFVRIIRIIITLFQNSVLTIGLAFFIIISLLYFFFSLIGF